MSETAARCAVYARYSSEKQNPLTVDQQIRKCREHAQRNGWLILEDHLYADEAVSGASTDRAALQRLLSAVAGPSIPFDCILIDDQLIGRNLPHRRLKTLIT